MAMDSKGLHIGDLTVMDGDRDGRHDSDSMAMDSDGWQNIELKAKDALTAMDGSSMVMDGVPAS